MPEPLAQICFAEGSIDGELLARLAGEVPLGFTPRTLMCDALPRALRYGPKALERLAAVGRFSYAEIIDSRDEGHAFSVSSLGGLAQQLIWDPADGASIEPLTALPGLNAAYFGDGPDARRQSRYGEDLARNWGRRIGVGGIWLWAPATMWFGPGAFGLIDRARLLSLPVGEVSERADGIIRVDLFPFEWYASDLDAARERQRRFWEWLGLAALEARKSDIEAELLDDPDTEIETGTFEHGGRRRLTLWLDAAGRPTPRSRASHVHRSEQALDGTVLWSRDGVAGADTSDAWT
jgi:hypothetical protein